MLIVKIGTVTHNGKDYVAGEVMPEIAAADKNRLIKLGVCVSVGDQPSENEQKDKKTSQSPTGTTDAGGNTVDLGLNAEAAIKAPKK